MGKPFAAMIVPFVPGAHPDHELPKPPTGTTPPPTGQPPRPDHTLPGDLPHPEHPIYYPLPPGIPVYPDNALPGDQPKPDHELPGSQPRPDHTLPGDQPHPDNSLPEGSGDWKPVYIWGGGNVPMPTPPIHIPPEVEVDGEKLKVTAIWTPDNGWETIVILKPSKPTVTPSKRK